MGKTYSRLPMKTNCAGCNKEFEMTVQQKVSFTKHKERVFCASSCFYESRTLSLEERVGDGDDEWYMSDTTSSKGKKVLLNRSRRRKTEKENRRANKIKIIQYLGGQCFDCGVMYNESCKDFGPMEMGHVKFLPVECFDIDHVLRENKTTNWSSIMKRDFEKWLKPELDNCKCELVCKNCHIIRTVKTFNTPEYKEKMQAKHIKAYKNQYN